MGSKFTHAVEDYYQSKKTIAIEPLEIETEENKLPVEEESDGGAEHARKYQELENDIIDPLLKSHITNLFVKAFYIHQSNERADYGSALERGGKTILDFFSELYNDYLKKIGIGVFNVENLKKFIHNLSIEGYIPYFDSEIESLVRTTHELANNENDMNQNALKVFEIIMEFYNKLKYK